MTKARTSIRFLIAIALSAISLACSSRSTNRLAALPDVIVQPQCLTKPVTLRHCNLKLDPPQCSTAIVPYKKGCEQISISPQQNQGDKTK